MSVPSAPVVNGSVEAAAGESEQPRYAVAPPEFEFERAFGAAVTSKPAVAPAAPPAEAPVGESEPGASGATLKPTGDEPPGEESASDPPGTQVIEKTPRRGKSVAAVTEDYETRLAEERSKWEQEKQRADALAADTARMQAEQEQAVAAVTAEIGPPEEFQRLNDAIYTDLNWEEQQKLDGWKAARASIAPRIEAARRLVNQGLMTEARQVAQLPGIEGPTFATTQGFAALCKYFYDTGAAQAALEHAERISVLEAELADARAQTAARTTPLARGGQSAGAPPAPRPNNVFDPTLPLSEQWDIAFGSG